MKRVSYPRWSESDIEALFGNICCVNDFLTRFENFQCLLRNNQTSEFSYTVTRPYAGFRHPDRMAPDQTVRGGENYCFIWSGNFLAQVAKFSSIFPKPGILQIFTWSSVRGVPFLCWYFTFLDIGRHFRNFQEILPCEKIKERAQGGIELRIYGMAILTSTSTPRLP